MKVTKYKKEDNISYTLGAFPTIELLKHKSKYVNNVYIHSSFKNIEVINKIKSLISENKIIYDDNIFLKLKEKDNTYVIATFTKFDSTINSSMNHILLDSISNMGNLGTIIRSCLGFNFKNIVLINSNIDIFDPKVIRSSMGSIFSVNIKKIASIDEYLIQYPTHHIYPFMLEAKNTLQNIKFKHELSSLVFGNESSGLDSLIYSRFDSIVISHSNNIDSLNITNAVSIALYEFNKQNLGENNYE